jgi:hypothetical protein
VVKKAGTVFVLLAVLLSTAASNLSAGVPEPYESMFHCKDLFAEASARRQASHLQLKKIGPMSSLKLQNLNACLRVVTPTYPAEVLKLANQKIPGNGLNESFKSSVGQLPSGSFQAPQPPKQYASPMVTQLSVPGRETLAVQAPSLPACSSASGSTNAPGPSCSFLGGDVSACSVPQPSGPQVTTQPLDVAADVSPS